MGAVTRRKDHGEVRQRLSQRLCREESANWDVLTKADGGATFCKVGAEHATWGEEAEYNVDFARLGQAMVMEDKSRRIRHRIVHYYTWKRKWKKGWRSIDRQIKKGKEFSTLSSRKVKQVSRNGKKEKNKREWTGHQNRKLNVPR